MTGRIVVDARLLHYNQTGIGMYLRYLYAAMARVAGESAGAGAAPDVRLLYHRRDGERVLRDAWQSQATAWTPPHHRLERWTLALELVRQRPALVHAPDHVCPQPLGWRTVLTVHDLAFRRMPETHSPASRAFYGGLERSVRQATRVICVSEATKHDLVALTEVEAGKVRVVYEAPGPIFTPHGPVAASQRPYFLYVGTIEPRKNLAGILHALAELPRPGRPELRVIGSPGLGSCTVMALPQQLGLHVDVRFLGRMPAQELVAQYRGALALVYPSLLEGFGLTILEAMASGAPVITSDRSSMAEVAGDAGELVDPHDTAALAAAMGRLAEDPARRAELRRRGRRRAQQFSWERAARETLGVFGEALDA